MKTNIKQFVLLRSALQQERARLQARLTEIDRALDQSAPTLAPSAPTATAPKKQFSAATIAKMRASQQARWAKKGVAVKTAEPKQGRKKMSAEARARISVASKARWAKFHAEKAAKLKTGK